MAGTHNVDLTFELTKDEIYGVVTRSSPAGDSIQTLCYTSDGFNPLLGLDDARLADDGASLRLGPPIRLREPSGDPFELPDPSRPWWRDELHVRSAVCEPYTNYVYFGTRSAIWRLDANDTVTRVAGHRTEIGEADGPGDAARFDEPECLAADGLGALYVVASTGDRLARITLSTSRSSSASPSSAGGFAVRAAARPESRASTAAAACAVCVCGADVLAVAVTTMPTDWLGKVSAAVYDFGSRSLLVATRGAVYRLPTSAAGCLGAAAAVVPFGTNLRPFSLSPAVASSSPTSGGLECVVEALLVDSRGDVYLADMSEDANDAESSVQLHRIAAPAGSGEAGLWTGTSRCEPGLQAGEDGDVAAGGASVSAAVAAPDGSEEARFMVDDDGYFAPGVASVSAGLAAVMAAAAGNGYGCAAASGTEAAGGSDVGEVAAPAAAGQVGSGRGSGSGSGGSGSGGSDHGGGGGMHTVCSDLGLMCTTRLAVLPHGWLLAHDYEGNVMRFLRLGIRPSWPRGAELTQPPPEPAYSPAAGATASTGCSGSSSAAAAGGGGGGAGGLAADLGALLDSQPDATSDVTVEVAGRSFPCHRVILAARCEYFRRLFNGGFGDSSSRQVSLPGAGPDAFAALLRYIYTDRTDFPQPLLRQLAELADRLLLPAACRQAQRQLLAAATPATVVDDLLWAERLGMVQLVAALQDVFSREAAMVLLAAPDSVRRLVAQGSQELLAELLAAAMQRAA